MVSSVVLLLLHICLMNTRSLVMAVEDSASLNTSTAKPTTAGNTSTAMQHTKVTKSQSTPERILYINGVEEDYYEDPTVSPPSSVPVKPCPYDRCEHLSSTCEEIQSKAGGKCLCPGIDGPSTKPEAPYLSQVSWSSGDREVIVNWCSPLSTVHSYRVLYQGPDGQVEKGAVPNATYRSYSIANLLPSARYTVCVVAINNAGESPAEINEVEEDTEGHVKSPCRILYTSASQKVHLYTGIGVGLGALVIVMAVLGILLCNRKKRKNRMDVEEKEMGIPNHSYKAGGAN